MHQQVGKKDLLSNSFYDSMTLILKLGKDDTRKENYKSLSFMSKDANSKFGLSLECKVVLTLKNLIYEVCYINRLK